MAPLIKGIRTQNWDILEDATGNLEFRYQSTAVFEVQDDGDMFFSNTTGTNTISTGSTAGVARAIYFDIPVAAGGAAAAGLDYQFLLDGTLEAGLLAETDGAGTYREPVWKIPYYTGDYGALWAGFAPPTPANIANGSMCVAYNSNAGVLASRLYVYSNAAWTFVDL